MTVGVFFIKDGEQKKQIITSLAVKSEFDAVLEQTKKDMASKAQELQQIIDKTKQQKEESVASNPDKVTVQQPKTVTETVSVKNTSTKNSTSSSSSSSKKATSSSSSTSAPKPASQSTSQPASQPAPKPAPQPAPKPAPQPAPKPATTTQTS